MKQFFFAAALTFALAAGAVTVFTMQLTLAAAQTFTLGVGALTHQNFTHVAGNLTGLQKAVHANDLGLRCSSRRTGRSRRTCSSLWSRLTLRTRRSRNSGGPRRPGIALGCWLLAATRRDKGQCREG
jgi:hypothetical protein